METKDNPIDVNRPNLIGMVYPGMVCTINNIVSGNSKYFAYSTIVSVYVYQQRPLKLVNIITSKQTINTIAFSEKNTELIAIANRMSNNVRIINHVRNTQLSEFSTSDPTVSIGWTKEDTQVICFTKYFNRFYIFDVLSGKKLRTVIGDFGNIRVLAVSHGEPQIMIGGNSLGSISRFIDGKQAKYIEYPNRGSVCASLLDPNCETNCLIVWSYAWGIFDLSATKDLTLVHEVKNLSTSLSSACWSSMIPGQFFTGDTATGIIRVWNASSNSPLEIINIHSYGVSKLLDMKSNRILCGFSDGMVGVYDMESRSFAMKNIAGHTNTIFQIRNHPANDDIVVSAGAEGSICTWSFSAMKQIDRIPFNENLGILYSMEVSPGGGVVACGYKYGMIALFSLQTKIKLFDHLLCKDTKVIMLSFDPQNPETILCSVDRKFICAFDIQKREVFWTFSPKDNVLNVAKFSPHGGGRFIVTTHSGNLLVFNDFTNQPEIIIEIPVLPKNVEPNELLYSKEKSDMSFVDFSPVDKNVVATTDNDGYLRLWNLSTKTQEILMKMNKQTRAVVFHHELPNLIAVGDFEGKIAIYDTKKKQILASFSCHSDPIFTIEMHHMLMITASVDSSIKFWSLDNIFTETVIREVLLNKNELWLRPLEGLKQLLKLTKRCAKQNYRLANGKNDKSIENEGNDMKNLDSRQKFTTNDIVHINDIVKITSKSISKSMSGAIRETRLIKRAMKSKERLTNNAKLELFMGDAKKFCEYMFTAGDFDLAVAAAPAVSVTFWKEMMKNRMKLLDDEGEIADYKLAIGETNEAIDVLMKAERANEAFLVAAAQKNGAFKFDVVSDQSLMDNDNMSPQKPMSKGRRGPLTRSPRKTRTSKIADTTGSEVPLEKNASAADVRPPLFSPNIPKNENDDDEKNEEKGKNSAASIISEKTDNLLQTNENGETNENNENKDNKEKNENNENNDGNEKNEENVNDKTKENNNENENDENDENEEKNQNEGVTKMKSTFSAPIIQEPPPKAGKPKERDSCSSRNKYTDFFFERSNQWIEYRTASAHAQRCLEEGQIYLAAAAYLSVGDVLQCEHLLLKHGQLATAFFIDRLTRTMCQKVRDRYVMFAISRGMVDEVFSSSKKATKKIKSLLNSTNDKNSIENNESTEKKNNNDDDNNDVDELDVKEKERYVIALKYDSIEERSFFYQKIGLKSPEEYIQRTKSTENILERLHGFLLVGKVHEGVDFYLKNAKEMNMSDFCLIREMTSLMQMMYLDETENQKFFSIAVFSLYFAIYEAAWKGYYKILNKFHTKLCEVVKENGFGDWADKFVDETQKLIDKYTSAKDKATTSPASTKDVTVSNGCDNRIYTVGYKYLNTQPVGVSYAPTHMYGNAFYLEDGETTMTMEEALMWFGLCPFSPLSLRTKIYI